MVISEERCPGVYGKWAHANQCRTDLEGALGCLIYCLSTSLRKKSKIAGETGREEKKREGKAVLKTKASVPEAVCSGWEHGRHVQPGVLLLSSLLPESVFCHDALRGLSVAGSSSVAWEDRGN